MKNSESNNKDEVIAQVIPHVLIFPLPIQGPVNSMLKLAELILLASSEQIHITFLTTEHVHRSLVLNSGATRLARYHGFSFCTFDDGLPKGHSRGGEKFMEMLDAVENESQGVIKEMFNTKNDSELPITCFIADGIYNFCLDVGEEAGIPVLYFDTISPSCLWVYLCLPEFIRAGEVPFGEKEDLDSQVNIPGTRDLLRGRDLPDFCRPNNPFTNSMIHRVLLQAEQFKKAQGIILNTFEDLESPLLCHIRSYCLNNVYVVGPIHSHLKTKIEKEISTCDYSNSLIHEDRSCIEWLNQQTQKSVMFCSFGSQVSVTKDQLMEFWHGLVNSETRFLWVKRQGSVIGMDDDKQRWEKEVPNDLLKGIKENGFIASWVPQEEVLNHPSIGGFLTHSGWNSTIESIVAGVPMICWPHSVDQLVTSRYVSDVWGVGFDMKDTCDRFIIEKMVRDLMNHKKIKLLHKVEELSKLARQSVDKAGSSCNSLGALIDDIKSFHFGM